MKRFFSWLKSLFSKKNQFTAEYQKWLDEESGLLKNFMDDAHA